MARKGGKRTKKSFRHVKIKVPWHSRKGIVDVFDGSSGRSKGARGRPRSKGHGKQRRDKRGRFA